MKTQKLIVDDFSHIGVSIIAHTRDINLEHKGFRMKQGLLALISLLVFQISAFGQIESMYSLYRLNPMAINSAEAGLHDSLSVLLINRQQWFGLEGAPNTLGFSANLKWKKQSGLGLNIMRDEAGPVQVSSVGLDYAYHTRLNSEWSLAGGFRLGLANVSLNFDNLALVHVDDDIFEINQSTGFRFNTGWGIRLGNDKGTYFTLSQPRLLKYDFGEKSGAYLDVPYFYSSLGTQISLGKNVSLLPSILFRLAKDVPVSYDINLLSQWKQKLDLGFSYRNKNAIGIIVGFHATSRIYLGYIYENPISALSQVKLQTHELALRFRVK